MNPSYFRIRLPKHEAMRRFSNWTAPVAWEKPIETTSSKAIPLACDEGGNWKGGALFIHEIEGWTVFNDFTGCYSFIPAESWLAYAETDEFVFAGYNDAIGYGELIVISNQKIKREFQYCDDAPNENVNRGKLLWEDENPLVTWVEAATFVDEDRLAFSDTGWLWLAPR